MTFSRWLTETIPLKNPKNPEIYPETWYVNEKVLSNGGVLYIIEKEIKCRIRW